MDDNKLRINFTVCYRNGKIRQGIMYAEGNIQMKDGTLIARLDQLWTRKTTAILFPPESNKVLSMTPKDPDD